MNRIVTAVTLSALALLAVLPARAQGQRQPAPAQTIRSQFADVNRKVLAMAEDFPEALYGYKPTPEVRSFGDVIVHVVSGNAFGARAGRAPTFDWKDWTELDPKTFKAKAGIVAALKKSIEDATATLKATPDDSFKATLQPWMSVIEHAAEHYGQLVVYYRANKMSPPESRPKK
ncbi:MAG: DinB family protein [Bryobacteraceae bacterium]|jgi:hypothetical protein